VAKSSLSQAVVPIYNVRNITGKNCMTEAGYRKWESVICGFIDDEAQGLRGGWECPDCWISKPDFDRMPV